MPGYAGSGQATLIRYNEQKKFFDNEVIAATETSCAFELNRVTGTYYPWGFAVQIQFSGAPGTFEIDVMASETDTLNTYVKVGTINAVNTNNVARFESTTLWPKFVCLNVVSLGNSVSAIAILSR